MTKTRKIILKIVISALMLALCMVLPFLTGQIPQIGSMLLPMHIPVLLCGFFCGPFFGLLIGAIAPLLRSLLFGMPPLLPTATAMCFELATYGFVAGLMYKLLPKKPVYVYVALIVAMILGRAVWGLSSLIIYGFQGNEFALMAFLSGAFINAWPGIILQIVLIPLLVIIIKKISFMKELD